MGSEQRDVEVQGAGLPRVLLLLDAAGDRRVVASWLRDGHDVIEAVGDGDLEREFDLCLVDDGAYARLWQRVGERKRASEPVFLPFVLLSSRHAAPLIAQLPTHDIDEALDAPIAREVLVARIDVLLDRRARERRLHDAREEAMKELRESTRRFEILSEANSLLLTADDPEATIQRIADEVMQHLHADVFFNYVLDEGADRLRLNAWAGVDERVAKKIERLELGQAICGCVARDGERIVSADVQDNGDPRADLVRDMGVRCYCCHPLKAGGETIGTLSFGTKSKDCFGEDEIALMQTVANQISIAMENARLFDSSRQSARTFAALAQISSKLTSVTDVTDAIPAVLEAACKTIGSNGAALSSRVEGGWQTSSTYGVADGIASYYSDEDSPARALVAKTRRPFLVGDVLNEPSADPALAGRLGYRSYVAYPLIFQDEVIGTVSFLFDRPMSVVPPAEATFLERVVFTVSAGLRNSQLYERQSQQAQYAEALNRINATIHSTLEIEETLGRVVVDVATALGVEASIIQMRRNGYWESAKTYGLPEAFADFRIADADAPTSMEAVETRAPVVVNDTSTDSRVNAEVMARIGVSAYMLAPLTVRDEVVGVLFADRLGGATGFTSLQVDFLEKTAATVALAIENARLYEAEHDIADRLQSALLALPEEVRGVEFAHAYHSAAETARVGGDFYDLFELNHDHVGIVMGDVAGKGIDAAMLTSMVKNTIRAHADERGKTPEQILKLTNDLVYKSTPSEAFVTVFFGILDCRDGRLVYANAGHTTAILLRPDGRVARLPVTGPLLGAFADADFEQAETRLEIEELLFLYTDGLTEARRDGEQYGEERLVCFIAVAENRAPDHLLARLLDDVAAFTGNRLSDDLALLALRRVPLGTDTPQQQKLRVLPPNEGGE